MLVEVLSYFVETRDRHRIAMTDCGVRQIGTHTEKDVAGAISAGAFAARLRSDLVQVGCYERFKHLYGIAGLLCLKRRYILRYIVPPGQHIGTSAPGAQELNDRGRLGG